MFDEGAVLDGLNEQQRRAATQQGGPLLVLAGAGTGKTRTLVARAAWLHGSQGVPASRILLLTFTRRAASDMLARAAAWFEGSSDRICGGTFHAIAHKIIRQHAESFSLPPQFTILDQGDATDLLDVLRPDHGLDGTGQRAPRAAACADIYTRCVNTGRPVSEVVTAGFPWCKPFTAQLAALAREFNLSETVFPLPPSQDGATYRARIFTPEEELPFAGHPSVGVAWVLARDGVIAAGDAVQECGAGLLRVRVDAAGAGAVAEDVALALVGAGACGQGRLKPRVL